MGDKKNLDYIDYFRGIAILLIIAGHTLLWGRGKTLDINIFLFCGGTYIFVFIAGFLFQYLSPKFNTLTYYKKKLLNVYCPSLCVVLPVAFYYSFFNKTPDIFQNASSIGKFTALMLQGYAVNLSVWFIGMIMFIFLVSPLILWLKQKHWPYYITLFFAALILVLITQRQLYYPTETLSSYVTHGIKLHYQSAYHFLFFYLFGMEICTLMQKYEDWIKINIKQIFNISLFLFLFNGIFKIFLTKNAIDITCLPKISMTIAMLSGLYMCENKIKSNKALDGSLKFLAKYSFGIFFIHLYIINFLHYHTIYNRWHTKSLVFTKANTLLCFATAWKEFFITLFGSILILFVIKTILKKLGINNTRMFIGV